MKNFIIFIALLLVLVPYVAFMDDNGKVSVASTVMKNDVEKAAQGAIMLFDANYYKEGEYVLNDPDVLDYIDNQLGEKYKYTLYMYDQSTILRSYDNYSGTTDLISTETIELIDGKYVMEDLTGYKLTIQDPSIIIVIEKEGGFYRFPLLRENNLYRSSMYTADTRTHDSPAELSKLVLWLPMNGDAHDYSGYGNHGTVTGATLSPGIEGLYKGMSYMFDGVDDCIELEKAVDMIAVSMWVDFSKVSTTQYFIGKDGASGGVRYNGSDFLVYGGAPYPIPATINWTKQDGFVHFVLTRTGETTYDMYINGEKIGTTDIECPPIPIKHIGKRQDNRYWFNGKIDNLRFYNYPLSENNIAALYDEGRNLVNNPMNDMVLWLPLDGNTNDYSGYNNHASLYGAVLTDGVQGQGYSFDGVNDYIQFGNPVDMVAVSMMIDFSNVSSTQYFIGRAGASGGVRYDDSNDTFLVYGGTDYAANLTKWPKQNGYVHFVLNKTGDTTYDIYIDGVKIGTTDKGGTTIKAGLLGRRSSGYYFNGKMDDVRFYDRPLTENEVAFLYYERKYNPYNDQEEDVTDGLKLWLPINKNANDYSGMNNHGVVNGATLATGIDGQCYSFDGVNDYIEHGDILKMGKGDMSWTFWANPDDVTINSGYVFSKSFAGAQTGRYFANFLNNKFRMSVAWSGGHTEYYSDSTVTANQWIHVGVTIKRDGTLDIYFNGELDTSYPISAQKNVDMTTTRPFRVGAYTSGDGSTPSMFFKGEIDDVRVYNRALSAEEVKRIYDQREGVNLVPLAVQNCTGGLSGYWSGTINPGNYEKYYKSFKITTLNDTRRNGFIASQTAACIEGETYKYSLKVWCPVGQSLVFRMRQIVGGGGYFPQYITGNNDWQDVSFTFTANDNTSGMIEGFQHGGLVEDVFSFYIRDLKLEKVK